MKQLKVENKVQLDTKYSAIFCDDKYIYIVNKNNKYLRVYDHNLEFIDLRYVFIDCESICFDTVEKIFYTLSIDQQTKITRLDKEFNLINEKILKLNNQPLKISYNDKSRGLYLYTENSVMEFDTENIKLKKIINPYEEEYSPIVNNNFDFNLWEKQNNVTLDFSGGCKILDITSYDNKIMYLLNILDGKYYVFKCVIESDDIDIKVSIENVETFGDIESVELIESDIFDIDIGTLSVNENYLRRKSKGRHDSSFGELNKENDINYVDDLFIEMYKYSDDLNYGDDVIDKHWQKCNKDCEDVLESNCKDDLKCNHGDCKVCEKRHECNKTCHCHEKHHDCKEKCKVNCCDLNKSCCEIIHSVAFVELSISHILNAEGEKIQKVIKCSDSICEILETNNSVIEVIEKVTRLEDILCSKLKMAKELCEKDKHRCNKSKD